jgi:hypothetical protein
LSRCCRRSIASRAAAQYQDHCARCHALIDRDDPRRRVVAQVTALDEVGTDPTSALNLAGARIPTGVLAGAAAWNGGTYGETERALRLLGDLVSRSLARQPIAGVRAITAAKVHHLDEAAKQGSYLRRPTPTPAPSCAYKARPLDGIPRRRRTCTTARCRPRPAAAGGGRRGRGRPLRVRPAQGRLRQRRRAVRRVTPRSRATATAATYGTT